MPKQISLDGIAPHGINVYKDELGAVRVEANYSILAGSEAIRDLSRDVTQQLSPAQLDAVSTWYDGVFNRIAQVESVA